MSFSINMVRGVYRRIYSGATRGRRINAVSVLAELLFWRLHCVADDFGAFEADPHLIQCAALPLRGDISRAQITGALRELEQNHLIERYVVAGEHFGKIADFESLQPGNKNGRRIRRYPSPEESGGELGNPGESGGIQGNPGEAGKSSAHKSKSESESESESKNNKAPTARSDQEKSLEIFPQVEDDNPPETNAKAAPTHPQGQGGPETHSEAANALKRPAEAFELPEVLQTGAFQAAWEEWQQHRKEKRQRLTPTSAKRQLAELATMGPDRAIAAIQYSITNGWQGIFEPKTQTAPATAAGAKRFTNARNDFNETITL